MVVASRNDLSAASLKRPAAGPAGWTARYLCLAAVADGACALAAGLAALFGRFDGRPHYPVLYLAATLSLPAVWVAWLALAGGYDPRFIGSGSAEFRHLLHAAAGLTAVVAMTSFAAKLDLARGYLVIALPATVLLDLAARAWLRSSLRRLRRHGRCLRRVVVAGYPAAVAEMISALRRERHHGLHVVAACLPEGTAAGEIDGVPVHGSFSSVAAAVRDSSADTVALLACPEFGGSALRRLGWALEQTRTELLIASAMLDVAGPRTTIRPAAGLPLLHLDHAELTGPKLLVKGLIDRAVAAAGLCLLSPLLAGIALGIKLADGGPVLFRQIRVGKNGRPFTMYKFRSMVTGAEEQRATLAGRDEGGGPLFKIRDDPRVTRLGGRLRRWSLDELPQLANVLAGDMSLVGPRPPLPAEVSSYGPYVRRRLVVKPGLTGLWQVNGRSELRWDDAVRFDVRYVENWSFALDLQIIWKTWAAVIHGRGAY